MDKPATVSTVLHSYVFDTRTAQGKADWLAFQADRKASGARIHGPVYSDREYSRFLPIDGATVDLETAHLFDNQWNARTPTGEGVRVFDWWLEAEMSHPTQISGAPRGIKRGHWLEITPEMIALRRDWLKCGYCGHQKHVSAGLEFCPDCIGSEYLKPSDFALTRLAPVGVGHDSKARPPLTDAEQAGRLALYQDAQREGAKTRAGAKLSKFRAGVEAKAAKAKESAERERAGMIWLLDHDLGGLACDNTIYYPHTGKFSFGWRTAIDGAVAHEIMGKLSDAGFPFPYDVVTSNLGKLSGCVDD